MSCAWTCTCAGPWPCCFGTWLGIGLARLVLGLVLGLENHVLALGLVTLVLVNITGQYIFHVVGLRLLIP